MGIRRCGRERGSILWRDCNLYVLDWLLRLGVHNFPLNAKTIIWNSIASSHHCRASKNSQKTAEILRE